MNCKCVKCSFIEEIHIDYLQTKKTLKYIPRLYFIFSAHRKRLNRFKSFYLNDEGADVWFKFPGERIPAHKLMLTTMSPWMNTMFLGSLPEGDEVDMTTGKLTAEAFKEFLQFFYMDMDIVKLTMENIEGVIDLAKQSLTEHIFAECENFLMQTVTTDTMCFGYQLALRYGANKLKAICEDEICVNAEKILRSSSFMDFPYDFLQNILQCDALACEEKYIFDACIAWAKAACKRNKEDPTKADNLRTQLKDAVYQIRFISMTKEEIANCIGSCSGLFSADELEEIICMDSNESKVKKFNWTPRYFNLQWDKGRHLKCKRFRLWSLDFMYKAKEVETLTFTTNRRVLLNAFKCEANRPCQKEIDFLIVEMRSNGKDRTECYSQQQMILDFKQKRKEVFSHEAQITLNKSILLRPKHKYEIQITIKQDQSEEEEKIWNRTVFKSSVLVDLDILMRFDKPQGIISALNLIRFDKKNIFQKMFDAPISWIASYH